MIKQDIIQFSGNNVPISEVAKIMKKDKQFVRIGIQEKWLPIGVAYKKKDHRNILITFRLKNYMNIQDIYTGSSCQMYS